MRATAREDSGGGRRSRRAPLRHRRPPLTMNITPMIDVVFLLMSYFLMVAEFRPEERSLRVEVAPVAAQASSAQTPPPSADPFALPARPIRVTVRSLGDGAGDCAISTDSPLLAGAAVRTLGDLRTALASARGSMLDADQRFIVEPDEGARWEHVINVMGAVEGAGFERINLTEPGTAAR